MNFVTQQLSTIPRITLADFQRDRQHLRPMDPQHSSASTEPIVHPVFEKITGTWQYIVADPDTKDAVIIDSVLDFDPSNNSISTPTADALLELADEHDYNIKYILETHAHADHLTASHYLQKRIQERGQGRPLVGIGKRITQVQKTFAPKYGISDSEVATFSACFDKLFEDDEEFDIGNIKAKVHHLPGHTPDHIGYHIGSNVFTGDSIFNPDLGSARCDFPGGSANTLYASMQKLLALPDGSRLYTGHDYPPSGVRNAKPFYTVAEHKQDNKHVKTGTDEDAFVKMRTERDAVLKPPRLIHQSLQVNIRGGQLPVVQGQPCLRVPLEAPVGVL
jgi:glyoxylase-like metal-dependent hydrolase (beta-lactamase superfamily II)